MIEVTLPDGSTAEVEESTLTLTDGALEIIVHRNEAAKRTIERWKDKEVFAALRDVIAEEFQEVENALWQVYLSRFIDDAFGESLNVLGRIVGEPRNGRDDPSYRVRIRARIRVNQSFGTANDILAVLALLDAADFRYLNTGLASYVIGMSAAPSGFATASEMIELMTEATKAGVLGYLVMPSASSGFVMGDATGSIATVIADATGSIVAPLPDGRRTP